LNNDTAVELVILCPEAILGPKTSLL